LSESQTNAGVTTTTRNIFDHLGNLVSATDFAGNIATYKYDKLGRLIVETLPLDSVNSVKKYDATNGGNQKAMWEMVFTSLYHLINETYKAVSGYKLLAYCLMIDHFKAWWSK
jgi:YD repeat-containing protein